ncbi:MAG: hypothetical protein JSW61_05575 [Candidatus Thorarchaeota archaeon]|nr:MAG: hypothetical protein JSW61_05575 [Candidatus Thorarchaeota archaeon]
MSLGDGISGILVTDEGKKDQKQAMFLTDPQKAIELDHPARRAIIRILSRGVPDRITLQSVDKESGEKTLERTSVLRNILSITEIVKMSEEHIDIMELSRNQVNHHLPKMIEEGFIIRYGTLKTGKRTTDYYRRAAKQYVITMETPNLGADFLRKRETEQIQRTLKSFNLDIPSDKVKELIELRVGIELMQDKWRTKIANMVREDVTDPDVTAMYHWLLNAYSVGDSEYLKSFKRIRDILFENVEAPQ